MLARIEADRAEYLLPLIGAVCITTITLSLVGNWVSIKKGIPLLEIIARWATILAFSCGLIYVTHALEISAVENRPLWSTILFVVLVCLFLDSVRIWFRINGFSFEDTPLFPKYRRSQDADEWPADRNSIKLREWIRENGFKQTDSLRAYPFPELCIRQFHFDSKDNLIRLTVNFIPRSLDTLYVTHSATSISEDGSRFVTDNTLLPYGGCFPDQWVLERKPLNRSPSKLLRRHKERLKASKKNFMPWEDLPLDDVRHQNFLLEKANEDRGIFNPRLVWEQQGRFSQEGKYRMWKEMLLLKYLGVSAS